MLCIYCKESEADARELNVISSQPACWAASQTRAEGVTMGTGVNHMAENPANIDWLPKGSAMPNIIEHWQQQRRDGQMRAVLSGRSQVSATLSVASPDVLMIQAAVVLFGDKTDDGKIVAGISVAWFEIIAQLERDPEFLYKIPPQKLEEIVAGAYERDGWSVVLTPRSGDRGRDVIATRVGVGAIRFIDQIKAYNPGHVVTADQVRSMLGVLEVERNVSKGVITTTGRFAPRIETDSGLAAFMPYRLELKNGEQLLQWLSGLAKKDGR